MTRPLPARDSHLRSIVKGASYRVVGSVSTVAISFVMTGSMRLATLIGSGEILTKIVLFWGHERLWNRVRWGRASAQPEPARASERSPSTKTAESGYALTVRGSAHRV